MEIAQRGIGPQPWVSWWRVLNPSESEADAER